jgi:FHS family L-fucose permease-like MFS transporter
MAIPAALFIRRFTYKSGILAGLGLYALGCLLFIPAGNARDFSFFLAAYFIMTSGLAFLETTANPYILSMGPPETAARRPNFAQAFNPVGSLMGMFIAKDFILARLDPADEAARRALVDSDPAAFEKIQIADLAVIVWPYAILGGVVLLALAAFALVRLPDSTSREACDGTVAASLDRLLRTPDYVWGVVAQAFYVGVQIMVWTFIIQYAVNELGFLASTAQVWNIVAMVVFVFSRFVCTYLLEFLKPGLLLASLAIAGGAFVLGAIFLQGMAGLYCLVAVSACMSLMFPTIYGIALSGLGDDAKLGSAGLICAIGGGCFMPPLQALIMDGPAWGPVSATRASFLLPFLCFVVITLYGFGAVSRKPFPLRS